MSNKKFKKVVKKNVEAKAKDKVNKRPLPDHFMGHLNQLVQQSNLANMQFSAARIHVDKVKSDIEGYFNKVCAKMHLDPDLYFMELDQDTGKVYIVDKSDVDKSKLISSIDESKPPISLNQPKKEDTSSDKENEDVTSVNNSNEDANLKNVKSINRETKEARNTPIKRAYTKKTSSSKKTDSNEVQVQETTSVN